MCKKIKGCGRDIDKCLRDLIKNLNRNLGPELKTCACCCGHGKYPISILVKDKYGNVWDLCSNTIIPRKKRFYVSDKKGYYYLPEVHHEKILC